MKHLRNILIFFCFASIGVQASERPNILFIFADDQCFDTISALGNEEIKTPNLDRLVAKGTTFTHSYNMGAWHGAVCVASRTMLNTGRFVWSAKQIKPEKERQEGRFWAHYMEQAGYATYMTGKWHVGAKAEQAFQVSGTVRGGMPRQKAKPKTKAAGYNRPLSPEDQSWKPWDKSRGGFWDDQGKHWSEIVGEEGVGFVQQASAQDKPFFLYMAFNAPHDPRQSPKKYVDMYPLDSISVPENFLPEYPYKDEIGCSKGLRDEALAPFPRTKYAVKVHRQEYYAIISHMDAQIGRVLDALEKSGKADNTFIFFTADHGLACGQHGLMGKQSMYDHSVRAPFIVCGPGVKQGKNKTPMYLQDVMPTTLELAGVDRPEHVDFKSLLPLIQGEKVDHYESIYGCYMMSQRMITKDGFKLIHYPKANVFRLFDLSADPLEMNDLIGSAKHADKVAALKKELHQLKQQMNDPLLTRN